MKKRRILLCTALLALTCMQIAGTIDETDTGIGLTGNLYDRNSLPFPDITVRLKKTGFSTVTDRNGYYSLIITKGALTEKGIDLSKITDTLQYYKGTVLADTSLISNIGVTQWIDTLPPLYIVQHDISGTIKPATKDIGKVEVVVFQISGSDTLHSKTKSLHLSANSGDFSGSVYFADSGTRDTFVAYINIFNQDSMFIGRSDSRSFSSSADSIPFPDINPCNAFPVVSAGKDTTVNAGNRIELHAIASDSFGGIIKKWEWNIYGQGFKEISGPDTVISTPPIPCPDILSCRCSHLFIVRVTDNDGNQSSDTMRLTVVYYVPPRVWTAKDTTVSIGDFVRLRRDAHSYASCSNSNYLKKWEWNINNQGFKEISKPDTTIVAPLSQDSLLMYPCVLQVTDNMGGQARDTMLVTVLKDPPRVFAGNDIRVNINAAIKLSGVASQEFGEIIRWEWDINNSGFVETETPSTTLVMPDIPAIFSCVLRATDDDGNWGLDTMLVTVLTDPPRVFAGNDTTVDLNSTLQLRGMASQEFGEVIRWEWDINNSGFIQTKTPSTTLVMPDIPATFSCVLRATDDDGNWGLDTIVVTAGK